MKAKYIVTALIIGWAGLVYYQWSNAKKKLTTKI